MRRKLPLVALVGLAVQAAAAPATAQVLRGQVMDTEGHTPVAGARVAIRTAADSLLTQALTNASGEFTLLGLPEGPLRMEVTAFGYSASVGRTIQLGREPVFMEVRMDPEPLETDGVRVVVEVQDAFLRDRGFYHRKRAALGRFIAPERLEMMSIVDPSEIFRRILGMTASGGEPYFTRGVGSMRGCRPAVYQDGVLVRPSLSRAVFDDVVAPPPLIEAVETYSGAATVPPQWRGDAVCGVIVVWTKH